MRRPAWEPTSAASHDHRVDCLSPTHTVVLLGLRDVHVEHEKLCIVAVAMEHGSSRGNVEDDLAVANQLLQDLRVRRVSGNAIPDVEDEVLDVRLGGFGDRSVELFPQV